jgi:hypothetical protein
MKAIRLMTLLLACVAGPACAQSSAQSFYASCLSQAGYEHAQCLRSRHGERCGEAYRYEQQRCWNTFMGISANDPYSGGYPQRFEPVPIPQRRVYVLPGMR